MFLTTIPGFIRKTKVKKSCSKFKIMNRLYPGRMFLKQEAEDWKRKLVFLKQENAYQKTKLAELLQKDEGRPDLLWISEEFQTQFLLHDQAFTLMFRDINDFEKTLVNEKLSNNNTSATGVFARRKKLLKEISEVEISFDKLRSRFRNLN